jgi:hypothetical protein
VELVYYDCTLFVSLTFCLNWWLCPFYQQLQPYNAGFKLKQAGQSAGDNIADAAGKVGSVVRSRWAVFQEARQRRPPGETVQERFITAAATTSVLLRKGISETKEKVAVGKVKVEEVCTAFQHNYVFSTAVKLYSLRIFVLIIVLINS